MQSVQMKIEDNLSQLLKAKDLSNEYRASSYGYSYYRC